MSQQVRGDCGKSPAVSHQVRGDCGKSPVEPQQARGDRGMSPASTPHPESFIDDNVTEEDIFTSIDPMKTVYLALKRANKDLLAFACKWPKTDNDKAMIVELEQKIKGYGVSVIDYNFYKL